MDLGQTLSFITASSRSVGSHFDATGHGFRCHACGKMMATQVEAARHLAKHHSDLEGAKVSTKDREKKSDSSFAFIDKKTGERKLLIEDPAHVRAAMARFNQTQGIPESEKKAVARRIARRAKHFGIDPSGFEKAQGLKAGSTKGEYIVPPAGNKLEAMKKKLKLRTQNTTSTPSGYSTPTQMPTGGPLLGVGDIRAFAVREKRPERY